MSELVRYKGVLSSVKGPTKTVQRSTRKRTVDEITGNRLLRELTRLGFSAEKRFSLKQQFESLDDLRYMNMKTLAVALMIYDEHPELHPVNGSELKSVTSMNTEAYSAVFNGQTMDKYIGFLFPTADKLKKRKIISTSDRQLLVTKIKVDLLRYILKIAEFLSG